MQVLDPATDRHAHQHADEHAHQHAHQRSLWSRFLDSVLPPADPTRLVPVADVARAAVPFVEGCLADAEIPAVVHEVPGVWGAQPRYEVLVAARDKQVATEVVAGF